MQILYNTVAYHSQGPKKAYLVTESATPLTMILRRETSDAQLWACALPPPQYEPLFGAWVRCGDFSVVEESGAFILAVNEAQVSVQISNTPWEHLGQAALKSFYFQRASQELTRQYAGPWARPAGHPDTQVLVHPSAAEPGVPAHSIISAPKGWYDAGDYNKYVVNSAITVWKMLALAEHFPAGIAQISVDIPPDEHNLPPLLAEVKWNLDWMAAMQAPDGGVYHKLTNLSFDAMQLPHLCQTPRYVVQKTTAAALYFAASMAQAARIYQKYLPELALQWLQQAERAFAWAQANPEQFFVQPADVHTGQYGNNHLADEWYWAAQELRLSTQKDYYQQFIAPESLSSELPQWWSVSVLGAISAGFYGGDATAQKHIVQLAEQLVAQQRQSPVGLAMQTSDFIWGSNGIAATQGMILLLAYQISPQSEFLQGAVQQLDYLLGVNPFNRSYVTGFGRHAPQHIHHRISAGDSVAEPVPGLLVGGPNVQQQDAHRVPAYAADPPAGSYLDLQPAFASNEVAINWNAPLVYLLWALRELLI